jgi:hypothetical protein
MQLLLLPLLVAGFGWLISWGFIKIIFFPHQSFRLAGRQWQSIFSKKAGQISISQLLPELKSFLQMAARMISFPKS